MHSGYENPWDTTPSKRNTLCRNGHNGPALKLYCSRSQIEHTKGQKQGNPLKSTEAAWKAWPGPALLICVLYKTEQCSVEKPTLDFALKCQARQALYFHPSLRCCSNAFTLFKKCVAGWINLLASERVNAWQPSTPVQSLCSIQNLKSPDSKSTAWAKQFTEKVLFDLIPGLSFQERCMHLFCFVW